MVPLVISILMLAAAPAVYWFSQSFRGVWKLANRFLILLVASIVVLHLLPESIRVIGLKASALALAGLFLPSLMERLWRPEAPLIHRLTLCLAVTGLALHGMMDGAALAVPGGQGTAMQWAVLLHRLPAAILIWGVFRPAYGRALASAILIILALFTWIGFLCGMNLLYTLMPWGGLHYFQALVAGSLLHIAFDQHENDGHHRHGQCNKACLEKTEPDLSQAQA